MKIYLAARYSRRLQLCAYAVQCRDKGHTITSRWLEGKHQVSDLGWPLDEDGRVSVEPGLDAGHKAALQCERFAAEDLEDVLAADLLIHFTEEPRTQPTRGGRWVEMRIALGLRKRVWVVGPKENIFCWLSHVQLFFCWEVAFCYLQRGWPVQQG